MQTDGSSSANDSGNPVDVRVEAMARALSQKASRRSVLGWTGKALLAMVGGVLLVPTLPADRRVPKTEASSDCNYWQYCYMHGVPCSQCGATDTTCPSGCTAQSYWTHCCWNPSDGCYYNVDYVDCCGCSPSCDNTWCTNSNQGSWCSGGGGYGCTQAVVHSKCPYTCVMRPPA